MLIAKGCVNHGSVVAQNVAAARGGAVNAPRGAAGARSKINPAAGQ